MTLDPKHPDDPQGFWNYILLKMEIFGRHESSYPWCNATTAFNNNNIIQSQTWWWQCDDVGMIWALTTCHNCCKKFTQKNVKKLKKM